MTTTATVRFVGPSYITELVRAGHDTADKLFALLYETKLPRDPFSRPVCREVRELHDAIQGAKHAGLIRLETLSIPGSDRGREGDDARSWWVCS